MYKGLKYYDKYIPIMYIKRLLHTQEVTGSSPVPPTIASILAADSAVDPQKGTCLPRSAQKPVCCHPGADNPVMPITRLSTPEGKQAVRVKKMGEVSPPFGWRA